MEQKRINITVKLFAIYQEIYGQEEIVFSIGNKTQVKEVLNHIIAKKPILDSWRSITRIAVNYDFVDENYLLQDGDEIALIPPVSGG